MIGDQQSKDAERLLFQTIGAVDPATGEVVFRRVETALYRDYCERRVAFAAARAAYTAAYKAAQATVAGRHAWPLLAMQLTISVTEARNALQGSAFEAVAQAEALLEREAAESRRGP